MKSTVTYYFFENNSLLIDVKIKYEYIKKDV